jgi:crotonobetainyl-CoA:carnitine CoA-transferase CaiB-like acyl-CoA transferase
VPLLHQDYSGEAPQRQGLNHPSIAPYGAYRCKAGTQIVLSIQNHREWIKFCNDVLIQPELVDHRQFASNVLRCENRAALDRIIENLFGLLSHEELVERLNQGRIAYGCLSSVAGLSSHPQLRRATVDTPSGPVELVAQPAITSTGVLSFSPVPAVGAHNRAIREEYSDGS